MVLDSGNLFFSQWPVPNDTKAQMSLKASVIADVYKRIGIDALNVGVLDLGLGIDFLIQSRNKIDLPFVSSNIVYRTSGKPVFQSYIIKDVNGVKVAIIGLIPVVYSWDIGEDKDIKILPPIDTAKYMVGKLRKKADLLILLSNLGQIEEEKLAKEVAGIDIIFGGGNQESFQGPVFIENVLMLKTMTQGKEIGRLDLSLKERGKTIKDASQRILVSRNIAEIEEMLQNLLKKSNMKKMLIFLKTGKSIDAEISQLRGIKVQLETQLKTLKFPVGNTFISTMNPMDEKVLKNKEIDDMIKGYKHAVNAVSYDKVKSSSPDSSVTTYTGEAVCAGCHPLQSDFWKSTRHAKAYNTLVAKNSHRDIECVRCHTTGYGTPGGFRLGTEYSWLVNVQCEACHGPGANHLGKGDLRPIDVYICKKCHDADRDPEFNMASALTRISCPK